MSQNMSSTKEQPSQDNDQLKELIPAIQPTEIERQLPASEQEIEQIISVLRTQLRIPKRENKRVTIGRATEIEVNHLPLNLEKLFQKTVYHMDVQFIPKLPGKLLRDALEEFFRVNYPNVNFAFDGQKNIFTTAYLRGKTGVVSILDKGNNSTVDLIITTEPINEIEMSKIKEFLENGSSDCPPGEALNALDVVLQNRPLALRYMNCGRSIYPISRDLSVDFGETEIWKSFFQNPIMGWKPYLVVDVVKTAFHKNQTLLQYIQDVMRCDVKSELQQSDLNKLSNYIVGLKIAFQIPKRPNTKRSYRVVGLLDSAENFFFDMEHPNKQVSRISVVQYFKRYRNYNIKYPKLPCLQVGNVSKNIALPIELCAVQKGQLQKKQLAETQIAAMVRHVNNSPAELQANIAESVVNMKFSKDPVLKDFGIEITEKLASVPARVLDQPTLQYADREVKPHGGTWRSPKLSKAVEIKRWSVINLEPSIKIEHIRDFEDLMIANRLSIKISRMNYYVENHISPNEVRPDEKYEKVLEKLNNLKSESDLIVIVISKSAPGVYATIKRFSELHVGVLTQCITPCTLLKMEQGVIKNILLKINTKLNGVNHALSIKHSWINTEGAIIFGASAYYSLRELTNVPTIIAVAASHDVHGVQYNMEWRFQKPKTEIIEDLENIIHTQLIRFKENTNTLPKKIIYYRDSLSGQQYTKLLDNELIAIRRACLRLHSKYMPGVTILVVNKKHRTKMFAKSENDMEGEVGNICPGTVVDTQITHPTEYDFYLCSHVSHYGTSKPTKYHLLFDDSNWPANVVVELTYYLCYMFVRCDSSVSFPAPTYYAHLAVDRAKVYIENKPINLNRLEEEQKKIQINAVFASENPMYFI